MIKIRSSALPYYLDCPRRAAPSLFWRELQDAGFIFPWQKSGVAAAIGSGTHKAAESYINTSLDTGTPGNLADGIEKGIYEFRDGIKNGVFYDDISPNNNDAEKQIDILSRSYYFEVLPNINLNESDTEIELSAEINSCLITGHADFISGTEIRDLKCSKPSDSSAQLGAYSLLNRAAGYENPVKIFNDFLPRVPLKKPYPGPITVSYDTAAAENSAYNIIKIITRDINEFLKDGDPWAFPANPKSFLCNPKYCKAFGSNFCKMGIKK